MPTKEQGIKLVNLMRKMNFPVDAINIVFLRDTDADSWLPIGSQPDRWNDTCVLVTNKGEVLSSYWATCEPGRYYTENPMNSQGAFRLAADYYHKDGWKLGQHFGRPALEQANTLFGYRDANRNFVSEENEATEAPEESKVNIHNCGVRNGNGLDGGEYVSKWSAGCCVIRNNSSYQKFLTTVRGMGKQLYSVSIIKGTTYDKFANV